jgi:hypothetical protein
MDWFGTRDPEDAGGNEKSARVEAYELVGPQPQSDADQAYQPGELVFCRDFAFRELASLDWSIDIVVGDVRCEPRHMFSLPEAE